MSFTSYEIWALIHGMGFGGLYLLACSGALVAVWRWGVAGELDAAAAGDGRFLAIYLTAMAVLAWLTDLTGTYIVYPWYRAVAPKGTTDLKAFPQALLMSSPVTAGWHSIGMEWKEHVAWIVPIVMTAAAVIAWQYRRDLHRSAGLRRGVLTLAAVSLIGAAVAGFFGGMLVRNAPVNGGGTIRLMEGQ